MLTHLKIKSYDKRYLYYKDLTISLDIDKYYEKISGKQHEFHLEIHSPNPRLEAEIFSREFDQDFSYEIDGYKIHLTLINKEILLYAENYSLLFKSKYKKNT